MPRTYDGIPINKTAGKRTTVVRTHILDRMKTVRQMKYSDGRTVHVDNAMRTRHELLDRGDVDPIRHGV